MLPNLVELEIAGMACDFISNLNGWQDVQAIQPHLGMASENFLIYNIVMRDINDNEYISRQSWRWAVDSSLWSVQHESLELYLQSLHVWDHIVGTEIQHSSLIPNHASDNYLHSQSKSIKHNPAGINSSSNTHTRIKHKYSESGFIYGFKPASEERGPEWLNVGELDPGRIDRSRGCCAKALIFVPSPIRVGYLYGLSF